MHREPWYGPVMVAMALLLLLALAAPADARKFQMSGTWLVRQGGAFFPLQFAGSAGGTQMTHISMGLFTEAPFDPPGQVVSDAGPVTAEGSAPAALRVPKHRFVRSHDAMIPLSGVHVIQITTMLAIDAPYATATLEAGGGPGSFTWCPANPACTPGGLPPGPAPRGRIVYAAGANQFGGTMQLGLAGHGLFSVPFPPAPPVRVLHNPLLPVGSGPTLRALAVGAGTNDAPHTVMRSLPPALVTVPTMAPAMGSFILYPGPFLTTLFGNTATMPGGKKFALPTLGMGAGVIETERGFPHTTGTVIVQQTNGSDGTDFFTVMGSDARTSLGAGNIALVAGGLTRQTNLGGTRGFGTFHRVSMSLGAPVPSLSPAGVAAAGALILLGVGYARRRRRPEPSSR